MRRPQDVVPWLQLEPAQDVACFDFRRESAHGLERRVAGNDDLRRVNALAKQVFPVISVIRQQNIADMVDYDTVALLRHAAVPRPKPGFHVKNLDTTMRRRQYPEASIGIAENHQG